MSGQVAAALAARLPDPDSEVVRAVDRWLWRDAEPGLPSVTADAELPVRAVELRSVDVPRGTPAASAAAETAVDREPRADGGPGSPPEAAPDQPVPPGEDSPSDSPPAEVEPGDAVGQQGFREAAGAVFAELAASSIVPNPRQPRQVFDEDGLAELAASIREVGLLQPIVVRPAGDHYELVMGERRWRAAQLAGLALVPAIVKATGDDVLLRDALLENIQRVQLNPLEEAAAYGQLLEDFGCTQDELATRLGRSRPQVTNTLRLLRLTPPVQRRIAAGVLSAGHAKALLGLTDPAAQEQLAGRVVAEGLSVRTLEELVSAGTPAGAARRAGRQRVPTAGPSSPVATRLADRLDTRVTVSTSGGRGRLVVEFAGPDDLARIADLIDPAPTDPPSA